MPGLLLTGLQTSGKTSLARFLLTQFDVPVTVVSGDQHRFVPGEGWTKRPLEDYVRSVQEAMEAATRAHPDGLVLFEGSVCDVSDPEDARGVCALNLCQRGLVHQILVLDMDPTRLKRGVITRVMRRAGRYEPQNRACDETPDAVERLLAKVSKMADMSPLPLEPVLAKAAALGVPVARTPALPLPEPWTSDWCPAEAPFAPAVALLMGLFPSLRKRTSTSEAPVSAGAA